MTPTDDQLREAARKQLNKLEGCSDKTCCPDNMVTIEANGTIWRTPRMAFVTCVVAVPLTEAGEVEG